MFVIPVVMLLLNDNFRNIPVNCDTCKQQPMEVCDETASLSVVVSDSGSSNPHVGMVSFSGYLNSIKRFHLISA